MKPSRQPVLFNVLRLTPLLASLLVAGHAAAITINQPSSNKAVEVPSKEALHGPTLPPRNDELTIDWVDAKAGRIAIGGRTYVVSATAPKIVLGNGDEVTSIGYLRAGMHVHIEAVVDRGGVERLATIRVAA